MPRKKNKKKSAKAEHRPQVEAARAVGATASAPGGNLLDSENHQQSQDGQPAMPERGSAAVDNGGADDEKSRQLLACKGNGEQINFERLVKRMPHATQQLKDGTLSPKDFASDLSRVFTEKRASTEKHTSPEDVCHKLATRVWPISVEREADKRLLLEFGNDLSERNQAEFDRYCQSQDPNLDKFFRVEQRNAFAGGAYLQRAFTETCRSWSKRLDRKYFNGKTGAFLRSTGLYRVSPEEWKDCLGPLIDLHSSAWEDSGLKAMWVQEEAEFAAGAVVEGLDDVWIKCWECGENVKDLKVCSRCSVARYCCRECQVTAWSGGHKHVCSKYKPYYESMLENLRTVDADREHSTTVHGFRPNEGYDIQSISYYVRTPVTQTHGLEIEGPSLAVLHKNIGHIMRGNFWIHSSPEILDDYVKVVADYKRLDPSFDPLVAVCCWLCYDLHGYAACRNDGNVTSESIEAALWTFFWDDYDSDELLRVTRMPVEYFLNHYNDTDEGKFFVAHRRAKFFTVLKARAIKNIRKNVLP